ncbi:hypothetical protein [Mycobacteroides abscessus]|uniref:hypothetical protein n=1 Tax=Mycobacteroides abscessus TaxID=36809 RepID=UPI0018969BAF
MIKVNTAIAVMFGASLLLGGCSTETKSPTAASVTPSSTSREPWEPIHQHANAPISDLTTSGEHCFDDGTEAVAAQLRAAAAIAKENTEARDKYDRTGEKMPYGYPRTISDVQDNGTCYTVARN